MIIKNIFINSAYFAANNFPQIGRIKRNISALTDTIRSNRKSYSQFGEDRWIYERIDKKKIRPGRFKYIEVGGNHPTRISNTYLFYREGFNGIVIEPNPELIEIHRLYRKRDIAIAIGCGNKTEISLLNIKSTPVLSSFNKNGDIISKRTKTIKKIYVPIFPLDGIVDRIIEKEDKIFLLSIDTEGMDYEVLEGAKKTLQKTIYLVVEIKDEVNEENIFKIISQKFKIINKIGCNLIAENIEKEELIDEKKVKI